ncbi:hypothetical protein KOI35_00970 [Actinoplanes bogorensis]|uniref:Uncharacterized protein n=1 Tax=Paractinoplanes bogorensis TaxID=1610840 RepID=A0ABS5YF46_9ACTN|nr:hypothetical protein [Actinoplanes bogorensis]MBU2662069.1 hypothetical protein [Actinoplanes bogorensis]
MYDKDNNEIPKRFLTYYERWGGYKQSPSGIALILGLVAVPIAVMYMLSDEPGDKKSGLVLLAVCVALLTCSGFVYRLQDRSFQRRMVAYDDWKRASNGRPAEQGKDAR